MVHAERDNWRMNLSALQSHVERSTDDNPQRNIVDVMLRMSDVMPDDDAVPFLKWAHKWVEDDVRWSAPEGMGYHWRELTQYMMQIAIGKRWIDDAQEIFNSAEHP